ncbi:MAG: hypothetical protein ACJ74Q_13075 [Pyrinomonadaceae bacterium]
MEPRSHRPEECARAVRRGFEFLLRFARVPQHFEAWGSDFLNFFYVVADTAADAALRRRGRAEGVKLARRWRRRYHSIPEEPEAEDIYELIYGGLYAYRECARERGLKARLRLAVRRFPAADFLWFDPNSEPPPGDVPKECRCGYWNERGRKTCVSCRRRLSMMSPYLVWYVALIRAYVADSYGVSLGATYADVLRWLPTLRPYPSAFAEASFYDAAYAVTHIVYTLNDYDKYRLRPSWLPREFAFLKQNLASLIEADDPETVGEFMECLKSFGLSGRGPLIRAGTDFLLASQNADGSWGKIDNEDIYRNYHVTLAATGGLMEVRWRAPRLTFPELKPLLARLAKAEG